MHSYPNPSMAIVDLPVSEEKNTVTDAPHRAAGTISKTSKSDNASNSGSQIAEKPPFPAIQGGDWLIPKVEKLPADAVPIQTPHELPSGITKPKKPYGGKYRPVNGIQTSNHVNRKYGKGNREPLFSPILHTNARNHTSGRILESSHNSTVKPEHHVKRRRIEFSEEMLLGGDSFTTNGTNESSVGRWPGCLAETNHNATSNSTPSDFTMGKAAEFNKVEASFNPKRTTRTKSGPSDKGYYPGIPSSASSPIAHSPINGTKNSPILLKDDSKTSDNSVGRASSSPHKSKKTYSNKETVRDIINGIAMSQKDRMETRGDIMPYEDCNSIAASKSSPTLAVASENLELLKHIGVRQGTKKHRNSIDELHGNCNITPSKSSVKDKTPQPPMVLLDELSRDDNVKKISRKQKISEPVKQSAENVWPIRVYRTDSYEYLDVLLIIDERNRHFEIKLHEEENGKEVIDRSRINRIRCSDVGSKVVIDGPRKKNLATIHAFDFEQKKHCEKFVKKIEDMGICESNTIQRKEITELNRIFDDVAKKRQERESRRLSNEKWAEQDLINAESLHKATKRRSSVSCPDSESKRLRSDNALGSEADSRSIPQRRSARYLNKTHFEANPASHELSSKPEDLEKRMAEQSDTQKLEPWPEPIIYPSTGTNRTTVEFEDIFRLKDGEFLNDNIISFYLRYLYEYSGQNKDKIYIFNTYFFSRLTSGVKKDIDYEAVEKWTSKVNIFDYEYLVVPVNHSLHWYLVIIYNSSYKERATHTVQSESSLAMADSNVTRPSKHEVESTVKSISAHKQYHSTSGIRKDFHRLALNDPVSAGVSESFKEHEEVLFSDLVDRSDVSGSIISKYFSKPNEIKYTDGRLKSSCNNGEKLKDESSPSKAASKENKARFFLISLDSFGESRPLVLRALKLYLIQEARSKHKFELELDQKTFKGATAKGIPLQHNGCDCGVYLLNYVEKFIQNPRQFMEKLIHKEMSMKDDWPEINTREMRKEIREKLFEVQRAQENRRQQRFTAKREKNEKRNVKTSKVDQEEPKYVIQVQDSDSPELMHTKTGTCLDIKDPKKHKIDKQIHSSISEIISEITSRPPKAEKSNTYSSSTPKEFPKKGDAGTHKLDSSINFFQGVRAAGAESPDVHI